MIQSKHDQRDLELPEFRQKLMQIIEQDVLQDEDIVTVFYGGSIGKEDTDLYSDIDLRLIVKPEKFSCFLENKRQRTWCWGNVLFFEDPGTQIPFIVAHYDCFIKVDSFYYRPHDLKPSIWLKEIKVVHDSKGILKNVIEESMKLTYEPTKEEIELWRLKFFAYLHEVYRRVRRKEYFYALRAVDYLRWSVVTGWNMEAGRISNSPVDWSRLEGERSNLATWQLELLEQWDCSRNESQIMKVLVSITKEFRFVHKKLCEISELKERTDWVDKIFDMVL